jgi:hypothetical protein
LQAASGRVPALDSVANSFDAREGVLDQEADLLHAKDAPDHDGDSRHSQHAHVIHQDERQRQHEKAHEAPCVSRIVKRHWRLHQPLAASHALAELVDDGAEPQALPNRPLIHLVRDVVHNDMHQRARDV